MNCSQGPSIGIPSDNFEDSRIPIPPKKDKELLEFLEKKLGGGRVVSQK
jgi:hypothetical protein